MRRGGIISAIFIVVAIWEGLPMSARVGASLEVMASASADYRRQASELSALLGRLDASARGATVACGEAADAFEEMWSRWGRALELLIQELEEMARSVETRHDAFAAAGGA
jgi:WXG100 family type VII secretion target